MKNTILVEKSFKIKKNLGIEVGIVSGNELNNGYEVIEIKRPHGVGVIGVNNGEEFAIKFKPTFDSKFGLAVYMDGVNVNQAAGIINLNSILKDKMNDYDSHQSFVVENSGNSNVYLNRYNQINNQNRVFTFTTEKNSGINEVLISDPIMSNRIDIYLWIEYHPYFDENSTHLDYMLPGDDDLPSSKIGAGRATNEEYASGKGLSNPYFLGRITFIHLRSEELFNLKRILKNVNQFYAQDVVDPMDKIRFP